MYIHVEHLNNINFKNNNIHRMGEKNRVKSFYNLGVTLPLTQIRRYKQYMAEKKVRVNGTYTGTKHGKLM